RLELLGEAAVPAEAEPVRDDDDAADLGPAGDPDQVEDLRVRGRLAAREGDALAVALVGDHAVGDARGVLQRAVPPVLVVDDADRALEVAVVGHLDEGQAGVLLVVVAGAAVGRAAVLDGGGEAERLGAGARVGVGADVVGGVLGDQRLRRAARGAALLEVDAAVARDDVADEELQALRAGRGRLLDERLAGGAGGGL